MAKFKFIVFLIVVFSSLNSYGQEINNVRVSQEGSNVLVMYNLSGKPAKYQIDLFYTLDDGKTWQGPLKHLTGDFTAQMPGTDKKVYWNATVEKGQVEGFIQFKLYATILDIESPVYSTEYYKYKKSKTIWLTGAVLSGAFGVFSMMQANNYYSQYTTATTTSADLHQKVKLYDQITPVAFGVAGFCALEFILKAGKQSKAKKQALTFAPVSLKNGAGIGLAYTF